MNILNVKILMLVFTLFPVVLWGNPDELRKNFQSPPAEYSLIPFWSWNGTLEADRLTWQIDQMLEKGINGAFLHARAGLETSETPYFSEGFWKAMDTTVNYSVKNGFYPYLYDEDKWPSGSAGGRTLERNFQEFVKKGLKYQTMQITGPNSVRIPEYVRPIGIFATQMTGNDKISIETLTEITHLNGKNWEVPDGKWAITAFVPYSDPGKQIDYLDKKAVEAFIDITHENYFRRYGKHFGSVIPGVFFDEIHAHTKQSDSFVWTDDFLEKFEEIKGYDLRLFLPLLVYPQSGQAAFINHDYFDVFTTLYTQAWFKTYRDWCEKHGIWVTGHTEEGYDNYLSQGDYFQTMGQLQVPGTDNEYFRYGFPRIINWQKPKQISSVAHMYGKNRVMVEAMGGGGYIIPLEEYRYGFGMLGAYGVNLFVPHLFHYEFDTPVTKTDWPASWFYRNPYWKYFRPLADYAKRISYMGSQGDHVCDIAILYPVTSKWAAGFSESFDDKVFDEIQGTLLKNYRDFDLIDPTSLARAEVTRQGLQIHKEKFKVIILPDIKTITVADAQKLALFAENGGVVLAIASIPSFSPENPEISGEVTKIMTDLFGIDPVRIYRRIYNMDDDRKKYHQVKSYPSGGKAIFTQYLWNIPEILDSVVKKDIAVESDTPAGLKFYHRKTDSHDFWLLVNESRQDGNFKIMVNTTGIPEIWDPETGKISAITNYLIRNNQLETTISLGAWRSCFLVVTKGELNPGNLLITRTDLRDAQILDAGESTTVSGWARADTSITLSWEKETAAKDTTWIPRTQLSEILAGDDWEFILTPHELDYVWKPGVERSTVELPVMEFCAVSAGNETSGTVPKNSVWKTVRMQEKYSNRIAAERHLSAWNASWIIDYTHTKKLVSRESWFRKAITLNGDVSQVLLDIAADKNYELFINGIKAGAGNDPAKAASYDLTSSWKKGENVMEVFVQQCSGLLAEGVITLRNGQQVHIKTDDTWESSPDRRNYRRAFKIADPPLGKWGNIPRPGHSLSLPVRLWYRVILPPGTQELYRPVIQNDYEIFLNGKRLDISRSNEDKIALNPGHPAHPDTLFISFITGDLKKGIMEPLKVSCVPALVHSGDWNTYGLWWYSARGVYTQKLHIPDQYFKKDIRLELDLGHVAHFAEVWVNDKLVKFFPWGPFTADITEYVTKGENKFTVVVSNMLANKALWDIPDENLHHENSRWWHHGRPDQEPDKLNAGLYGPVKIVPWVWQHVTIKNGKSE